MLVTAFVLASCFVGACSGGGPRIPARAGVFRAAAVGLVTLDPAQASSPADLEVARALYAPLTRWNPRSLAPEPGLASSWTSTADLRVWTFMLRPGAMFSDGRPVTAADVKASYERVARREASSPSASLLAGIDGYDAFRSTAQRGLAVEDAGAGAVRITTTAPLAVLPSILASPALGIIPADVATPYPDVPVGSGPFRVRSRDGGGVQLARSAGSSAHLDELDLVEYPDDSTAWRAYRTGQLDWSPVPADQTATARPVGGVSRPVEAVLFYGFNNKDADLRDPAMRTAASGAVDRHHVSDVIYQRTALPTDRLLTPPDGVACPPPCGRGGPESSGSARAASVSRVSFVVDYEQDRTQDAVARSLATDLARVGITATPRPRPLADFQALAASGSGQLMRLGWIAPYPGPDGELAPLFATGAADNLTGFDSPAFDTALAQARGEVDPVKRDVAYVRAEQIVLDSGIVIPLVEFEAHWATAARVRGLVVDAMGGWDPTEVSVAPAGR